MEQIKIENLAIGYENQAMISNLNFDICEGDYICILGDNGVGKSTLVKTLLNLNKPISGKIELVNGIKRDDISYLPQVTQTQRDFPCSVMEVVLSGLQGKRKFSPFYKKNDKLKALDLLSYLEMDKYANESFRNLSGGQMQRVLLARALISNCKIIFFDEPITGLDVKVKNELYNLIYHINHDHKITIIMITHDLKAVDYSSHILHLGKENLYLTKDEYLNTPLGQGYLKYAGGEENV